jgi:hypothetical protein
MPSITVARKTLRNGRTLTYLLKHDDRGYYFDGLDCASFRRKTRASIEARAERSHFDVVDLVIEAN